MARCVRCGKPATHVAVFGYHDGGILSVSCLCEDHAWDTEPLRHEERPDVCLPMSLAERWVPLAGDVWMMRSYMMGRCDLSDVDEDLGYGDPEVDFSGHTKDTWRGYGEVINDPLGGGRAPIKS